MMNSAHSPTTTPPLLPPDGSNTTKSDYFTIMAITEEFDDPFKALSSSNLEEFALSNGGGDGDADAHFGFDFDNDNAPPPPPNNNSDEQIMASSDDSDPWAVLAAAAGEGTSLDQSPSSAALPGDSDSTETMPAASSPTMLTHAEGETFAMPDASTTSSSTTSSSPSILDQLRSSTTNLLNEVDAKTGISHRAKAVNDQFHISEKWSNFHTQVLQPTTIKTREIVNEKLTPTIKEHWGSMQQRTSEMGVKERMANVSSAVGQTWQSTSARIGHWKEEQEMKRALANARNTESLYGDATAAGGEGTLSSASQGQQQFQQNLEGAKVKVAEGWHWISQRIQETKLPPRQQPQQQQQQKPQPSSGGGGEEVGPNNRTSGMKHLDSDGLPSSFRKD